MCAVWSRPTVESWRRSTHRRRALGETRRALTEACPAIVRIDSPRPAPIQRRGATQTRCTVIQIRSFTGRFGCSVVQSCRIAPNPSPVSPPSTQSSVASASDRPLRKPPIDRSWRPPTSRACPQAGSTWSRPRSAHRQPTVTGAPHPGSPRIRRRPGQKGKVRRGSCGRRHADSPLPRLLPGRATAVPVADPFQPQPSLPARSGNPALLAQTWRSRLPVRQAEPPATGAGAGLRAAWGGWAYQAAASFPCRRARRSRAKPS
jgi:hypothetical protein